MEKLVQCVPNYSEGRDLEKIEKIAAPFKENKNIKFMGCEPDPDYNRTVITVIGTPEDIKVAMIESAGVAISLLDMNNHKGEHLRMGAIDVIPFIPIKNMEMKECVELSKDVAKALWEKYELPIFLYEESATAPNRVSLPDIRKGEYEGMKEKLLKDEWKPDYGKREPHPTAGVTAVGARMPLIAFNINLDTDDISIAKDISKAIRFSSGGFRYIQAGPADMKEKGFVQVTMNIKNYKKNPMYRVFETVKMEAKRYGVNVTGSEIIGSIPIEAIAESLEYYLGVVNFNKDKIIEMELLK